jgi:acetate kinase
LVREQVCKGLETFGIELDTKRNRGARLEQKISADQSPVTILILPADEERIVARATAAVIGGLGSRAAVPTRNPA